MPKTTVRLTQIAQSTAGVLFGTEARDAVARILDEVFDPRRAGDYDPLKVVISFEDLGEDVGALALDKIVRKLTYVYEQDFAWYVTFVGLSQHVTLYAVLGLLLKAHSLSILCEPGPKLFCGVTEQEMSSRESSYLVEDWRGMSIALDHLYGLGENTFSSTGALLEVLSREGYSRGRARPLLDQLDEKGLILQRRVTGSATLEWTHVVRYNPTE